MAMAAAQKTTSKAKRTTARFRICLLFNRSLKHV
jgi:hypothetical protein